MRLMIDHLPVQRVEDYDLHTLRHWLTFDDGRIFFQDELIEVNSHGEMLKGKREPWEQLPTPPMTWDVAGIIDHGGLPMAILRNGEAYIWATEVGEAIPRWIRFAEPVPGTHAALDLDAEAT